jgi:jumonji domain-containing protein 7
MIQIPQKALADFYDDVEHLWCQKKNIPRLERPPSALQFLRDFVAPSRPCIIRNAVLRQSTDEKSPILTLTLDDLVERYPEQELVVDATPDGHGDCLRCVADHGEDGAPTTAAKKVFVQPEERRMTLSEFRQRLRCHEGRHEPYFRDPPPTVFQLTQTEETKNAQNVDELQPKSEEAVLYYSRQNDCLRTELASLWSSLLAFVPETIDWAEEAFAMGPPDAVNLWIGNERATSSMHKDHYENLFYVLSGEKVFTICPPADAAFFYEQEFESGRFQSSADNGEEWKIRLDVQDGSPSTVRWIAADVTAKEDPKQLQEFPLLKYTHPIEVHVRAGELLYLPSLWFHRVTQTCETVGINYWFDMKFDSPNWCYFHFLQQLSSTRDENSTKGEER